MKQFKQSICLWGMGMLLTLVSMGQPNINRVEYYIDTDPGFGNGTSLNITPDIDLNALSYTIDFSTFSFGVHIVGMRSQNADGAWSHDNKWLFAKIGSVGGEGSIPNLSRTEYYIDTDPGYGNGTAVSIAPGPTDGSGSFILDITAMSTGVHLIGVRSQDANGAWSHDNKWLFAKLVAIGGEGSVPNLSKTEYYVDTDPGYGNGTAVTIAPGPSDGTGSFTLDITNMPLGVHIIGLRTQDANGGWSHDNKWLYAKLLNQGDEGATPKLSRLEYYFDNDPGWGNGTTVALNDGTDFGGILINANITGLSADKHKIFYRTQDVNGRWSHDNIDSFTLGATQPIPAIVINSITRQPGCSADNFKISYHATGTYNPGNVFNVELSDASGSFATPAVIGSLNDVTSNVVSVTLPAQITDGTAYRMRVSSTDPVVIGTNSDTLTMHNSSSLYYLTSNVTINGNLDLLNPDPSSPVFPCFSGKIVLGNYNLVVNGRILNYDTSHFIVTNGTGTLQLVNAFADNWYPVGTTLYNPNFVRINNSGAANNYSVRVKDDVQKVVNTGSFITTHNVNKTWFVIESNPGTSNAVLTLHWSPSDELASFNRSVAIVAQYQGSVWNFNSPGAAIAEPGVLSGLYSRNRTGISTFTAFTVTDTLSTLNNPDLLPGFVSNRLNGESLKIPGAKVMEWLNVSPNPAKEVLDVQVRVTHQGKYKLELMDMMSHNLLQKQFEWNAGIQSGRLILNKMEAGTYLVVLSDDKERITKKIIKVK